MTLGSSTPNGWETALKFTKIHLFMGHVFSAEKGLRNRGENMLQCKKMEINAKILPRPGGTMNKYTKLVLT